MDCRHATGGLFWFSFPRLFGKSGVTRHSRPPDTVYAMPGERYVLRASSGPHMDDGAAGILCVLGRQVVKMIREICEAEEGKFPYLAVFGDGLYGSYRHNRAVRDGILGGW